QLVYATYLGGSGGDAASAIAVDMTGNAYVTGFAGRGFPVLNAEQESFGGGMDAFVAKLDPNGQLVYATYLGGSGADSGTSIAVDQDGAAHVAGYTTGDFPVKAAAQSAFGGGEFDAFVAKLSPSGRLIYSTYLGGSGDDVAFGIAVDRE